MSEQEGDAVHVERAARSLARSWEELVRAIGGHTERWDDAWVAE